MEDETGKRCSGVYCVAEGCNTKKLRKEEGGIPFHHFPLKNDELCEKWIREVRLKSKPTVHDMLCGSHFMDDDYKSPKRCYLKDTVIPSVFQWSRKTQGRKVDQSDEKPAELKKKRDCSPTKGELKEKIEEQKKKIKSLQQKVRREKQKTKTLTEIIDQLKDEGLVDNDACQILKESFSGLTYEIIENHFKNKDRSAQGHRYSDEVKRLALAVHFYSPRAYEFLKPIFSLPHPCSLCEWTSSVQCEPGFFKDAFEHIKSLVDLDAKNADCALSCDGIIIKNGVVYNKRTGIYEGFIDLGPNIPVDDEDEEAKEALVFMLRSLRLHWKYPVGYVLINKINATTLHGLLSQALHLGLEHKLRIQVITMDGTYTNFSAMRLFGCKLGKSLELIDGAFSFKGYDYLLFFTPDAPHMLKVARNALGELKILTDNDSNKIEWRFIESLHEVQMEEGLKIRGNKLSKKHMMLGIWVRT